MPTDLFLHYKSCNNKPMQEYVTRTQQETEEQSTSLIQSGKLLSYANCVSPIALHDQTRAPDWRAHPACTWTL